MTKQEAVRERRSVCNQTGNNYFFQSHHVWVSTRTWNCPNRLFRTCQAHCSKLQCFEMLRTLRRPPQPWPKKCTAAFVIGCVARCLLLRLMMLSSLWPVDELNVFLDFFLMFHSWTFWDDIRIDIFFQLAWFHQPFFIYCSCMFFKSF